MAKIPVGRTIGFAYGFLIGQIGAVLAVAGLPALLYAGADYAGRAFVAARRAELGDGEAAAGGAEVLVTLAASLAMLFALSVAGIGVTRAALGMGGTAPVFPLDSTVWRMFAANLRFVLAAAALVLFAAGVSSLAFLLAGVPLDAAVESEPTPASVVAALVSWFVFLYVLGALLRMGFLLPAAVAAEAKGGLKRSHDLTKGNVWRVLAIVLALGFPIALLMLFAASAIVRSALGPDFAAGALSPELIERVQQAIADRLAAWEMFNAVIFVLYAGLMYSGAAFAYRAAAGEAE